MEILNLDFNKEENVDIMQKVLKKIKPFSKIEGKVEIEMLERFIQKMSKKYHIMIQWITPTFTDKIDIMYSASFKRTDNHSWLGNVYGKSIYELYTKIAVKMYTDIKTLDIPEKDWDAINRERKDKMKEIIKDKKRKEENND